jgi:primosomal protein N''
MSQNKYLYEWLATERYREREQEREHGHLLASRPRQHQSIGRHLMSKFGTMLVALGTRLEQVEQTHEQAIRPARIRI